MNCEHFRNDFRLIARYKFMQALDSRADNQVIERLGEWVGRFSEIPVFSKGGREKSNLKIFSHANTNRTRVSP